MNNYIVLVVDDEAPIRKMMHANYMKSTIINCTTNTSLFYMNDLSDYR